MRAAVNDELAQQIFKLYKNISQKIVCSSAYQFKKNEMNVEFLAKCTSTHFFPKNCIYKRFKF